MPAPFFTLAVLLSFYILDRLTFESNVVLSVVLGIVTGWGSLMRPEGFVLSVDVLVALWTVPQRKK